MKSNISFKSISGWFLFDWLEGKMNTYKQPFNEHGPILENKCNLSSTRGYQELLMGHVEMGLL